MAAATLQERGQVLESTKPDPAVLTRAIAMLGNGRHLCACRDAFQGAVRMGIANVFVYNQYLSVLARLGRVQDLTECFQAMEDAGVPPTVHTYTTVISAWARGGEGVRAFVFQFV